MLVRTPKKPPPKKPPPVQARAHATRELLLQSTAQLLSEVGVERLSSNLICAHAGLTPPAFYRYFHDKYAALEELGQRLMRTQNELVGSLLERVGDQVSEADLRALVLESIAVTKAFPGGPWVLRALRAVPALHHIRLRSHQTVSALVAAAAPTRSKAKRALVALQARLMVDMAYAAIELAFDEPALDAGALAASAARAMFALVREMRKT